CWSGVAVAPFAVVASTASVVAVAISARICMQGAPSDAARASKAHPVTCGCRGTGRFVTNQCGAAACYKRLQGKTQRGRRGRYSEARRRPPLDGSTHFVVVDDDREIRALLSRFLLKHGYRVSTAREGREARKLMADAAIDLVVLDLMMPGEDGLAFCRE